MRCCYCAKEGEMTKDHVPPKGFFPPPRPNNLIQVPCCFECNNGFSLDDEAVRAWFTASLGRSAAADWIFDNKVVPGTMKRSEAFRESMLASMTEVKIQDADQGEIDAISFRPSGDRVQKFAIRITKGLLHYHYPDYDYRSAIFTAVHIPARVDALAKLEQIKKVLVYDERGKGVFQYRRGLTDSKQSGFWIYLFYEAVLLIVAHQKNPNGPY
jgi:hypothetical protein